MSFSPNGSELSVQEALVYSQPDESTQHLQPEHALKWLYLWLRCREYKGELPTVERLEASGFENPVILNIIAFVYKAVMHSDPPPTLDLMMMLQGFVDPRMMEFIRANDYAAHGHDDWRALAFALNGMANFGERLDELEVERTSIDMDDTSEF